MRLLKFWLIILGTLFLAGPLLAQEQPMPEFEGIDYWINVETGKPINKKSLQGRVVLVDFWAYSCINCIRTLPHLKEWYAKYHNQGFEIVGVHTPEFDFEKDLNHVQAAVKKFQIPYPIALDNNSIVWNLYENRYWPAHYFIDRKGVIRYRHFGEGHYAESEKWIQELLSEGAPKKVQMPISDQSAREGLAFNETPEIYVGLWRQNNNANKENQTPGSVQKFATPTKLKVHEFAFSGDWRLEDQFAESSASDSKIVLHYNSSKANIVVLSAKTSAVIELMLDGAALTSANAGADVAFQNGRSLCQLSEPRLYNLTKTATAGPHVLEIRFLSPAVRVYSFTFG